MCLHYSHTINIIGLLDFHLKTFRYCAFFTSFYACFRRVFVANTTAFSSIQGLLYVPVQTRQKIMMNYEV